MRKNRKEDLWIRGFLYSFMGILCAGSLYLIWVFVPIEEIRFLLFFLVTGMVGICLLRVWYEQYRAGKLADDICENLDDLISGRNPERAQTFDDSLADKVQSKLLQYWNILREDRQESREEKENLQEIISDISHQVKTPMANIRLFSNILRQEKLSWAQREEFAHTLEFQVDKLEFLLQSLIKMSRLETGTFSMHIEERNLHNTLVQAVKDVWQAAEKKKLQIDLECAGEITAKYDEKWTLEALENILSNGVKYTPERGSIRISVHPWQFYTRVDITDTGIGIAEEHYNDIFQRFYRAEEVSAQEGVGLGLYLAQTILNKQRGYITVKSKPGQGSTFSVYLLSGMEDGKRT